MHDAQPRLDARPHRLVRRALLTGFASLAASTALAQMPPSAIDPLLSDGATLLVAGPEGGQLEPVAEALLPLLAQGMPTGCRIVRRQAGGEDGVTAANQFAARAAPDGVTMLMLPGAAPLAWLVGDPRAQFDAAHWLPVLAGTGSSVLVTRIPLQRLPPGAALRIAASSPVGMQLPALLGTDLLGLSSRPVFGLDSAAAGRAALAAEAVDAVFVTGGNLNSQIGALASLGATPAFTGGAPDQSDEGGRDPRFPGLPSLAELMQNRGLAPTGPAYTAWRAAAAAIQTRFALVLPELIPATLVAMWRGAAHAAAPSPTLTAAIGDDVRLLSAPAVSSLTGAIAVDQPAMVELRRWLLQRFGWRPA